MRADRRWPEGPTESAFDISSDQARVEEKKRQHRAFVNARLFLVLMFIGLWPVMAVAGLRLPAGYLIALIVEAGALVLYGRFVPRVRAARTIDRMHYLLLTAEIGFHSAIMYFLGGASWVGSVAYIYAVLYAGAFLTRWQTVLFAAAVASAAASLTILDATGVIPHQVFLPQGPDRYQDVKFVATSVIMFTGVLATIAFWVAWLGNELRRERDEALRANAELMTVQEQMRRLNEELEKKVEERTQVLSWRAEHDQLTGLLNRGSVSKRCQELVALAKRGNRPLSVIVADGDNFKSCNDNGGHGYGDEVLRLLSESLRESCRESDVVGRLGGDEFLIVLPDTSTLGAIRFCRRVVKQVAAKRELSGGSGLPMPSLSLGIAVFPDHGLEVEELIRVADKAMYDAKADGGGCAKVGTCGATFLEGRRVSVGDQ